MTEAQLPSEILLSILRVLERVEERLEKLDKHFELAPTLYTQDPAEKRGLSQSHLEYDDRISSRETQKEPIKVQSATRQHAVARKVRYGDWGEGSCGLKPKAENQAMLQRYLGDYWKIPNDNRLTTFKPNLKLQSLETLRRFDSQLRREKGNDFVVIDYDSMNNTRIYRIGEAAIGSDLMVDPTRLDNAPWSRLM